MKTVKKILCLVLILGAVTAMSFGLVACNNGTDAEYITEKGTLVCGITLYEPMNYYENNELVGFETEFAKAVGEKLGLTVKFQEINWDSKILELNSKAIDCIWNGFTVNEERKGQVEFTKSYLNNSQCVVVKAATLAQYTSNAACNGKKAVAETGSAGEKAASKLTSVEVVKQSAQVSALTEVSSGTADFAVVDIILAKSMVGTGAYAGLAIAENVVLEAEEYAVGFRKGSDMAQKVNAVIDELLADGTLETIATKYGVSNALIREN